MYNQNVMEKIVLIFRIKKSRLKARDLALLETKSLFNTDDVQVVIGGPLSSQKGVIATYLPTGFDLDSLALEFPKLGYIYQIEIMTPVPKESKGTVKWKGCFYKLDPIYQEDAEEARNLAPDKRRFLLPDPNGNLRYVIGYRGDGTETGKRALPMEDCKLMLNLARVKSGQRVLDTFAGAGGIVLAGVRTGLDMFSTDLDSKMQYGLADFGSRHQVADVRKLPFQDDSFDAIVTEAPFDRNTTQIVADGLREMKRVIKSSGNIVLMVADYQADAMRTAAMCIGLNISVDQPLDRKGTAVHIFRMSKDF